MATMTFIPRSPYDEGMDSDTAIIFFDASITKTNQPSNKFQIPDINSTLVQPHMVKAAIQSWVKCLLLFFEIDLTNSVKPFIEFCEKPTVNLTGKGRLFFVKRLFFNMCTAAMNTQGIVSTTFGMRVFMSLETTLREQSVNTLTLERGVFLFHARGAESLIVDPSSLVNVNKRPTPSDQTGGLEPQGEPMVPKEPKGKQPKALVVPTMTPFKACFYDIEFKAKISGSKGCSANPCAPHERGGIFEGCRIRVEANNVISEL